MMLVELTKAVVGILTMSLAWFVIDQAWTKMFRGLKDTRPGCPGCAGCSQRCAKKN